jgi:hypothetical protein
LRIFTAIFNQLPADDRTKIHDALLALTLASRDFVSQEHLMLAANAATLLNHTNFLF